MTKEIFSEEQSAQFLKQLSELLGEYNASIYEFEGRLCISVNDDHIFEEDIEVSKHTFANQITSQRDWVFKGYDLPKNKVIETFVIRKVAKYEAENKAERYASNNEIKFWTITEIK
jgi:hypothetical protein